MTRGVFDGRDGRSIAPWYDAPDSRCGNDGCGHGPRWHSDPTGCTRMLGGWCPCERVYAPGAAGPDDYTGQDGAYFTADGPAPEDSAEHWRKASSGTPGECGYCGAPWSIIENACTADLDGREE